MGIVIRQSIKATVINYIGAFIGFLTTMFVVTKFLKPEEIGLTKVIYEVSFLFASLARLGTSASAMRFSLISGIHEGVQKVFGTLDLFVSLLETKIKYPILKEMF